MVVTGRSGRFVAIGRVGEQVTTVIFTLLGREAISVISMRRASRRERSLIDDKK